MNKNFFNDWLANLHPYYLLGIVFCISVLLFFLLRPQHPDPADISLDELEAVILEEFTHNQIPDTPFSDVPFNDQELLQEYDEGVLFDEQSFYEDELYLDQDPSLQ